MKLLGERNWYLPKRLGWLPKLEPEPQSSTVRQECCSSICGSIARSWPTCSWSTIRRTGGRRCANLVRAIPELTVVGEAASGEEALDAAAELGPELVLMDIRMPGMSGFEASRALRERFPARS